MIKMKSLKLQLFLDTDVKGSLQIACFIVLLTYINIRVCVCVCINVYVYFYDFMLLVDYLQPYPKKVPF